MTENAKRGLGWSCVVILDGANTRPFRRYTTLDLSVAAAELEPEVRAAPDYLIIHPKTVMGSLEPNELDALALLADATQDGLTVAQKQTRVREWLGTREPLYDALSEEATKSRPELAKQATPPDQKPKSESEMATKKGKKTAAKKPAKPAAKKAVKAKAAAKPKGDGLGREGTLTRFLCEGIVAKTDDKKLLEQARKKFPDKKVGDNYVSWYRTRLKKQGVIKG